ncbi:Hypothetical protein EMIHUDRAFT_250104, partial [Emiliania huxleyi CCMP1516]|uniref:GST N-terminal domain-containing protein n=2 Tax=Emiliania huxleyi TaxID=2903 RepID=A0A0D3I3P5_EMIH1
MKIGYRKKIPSGSRQIPLWGGAPSKYLKRTGWLPDHGQLMQYDGRGGHLGTRGIDWYDRIWQLLRQPAWPDLARLTPLKKFAALAQFRARRIYSARPPCSLARSSGRRRTRSLQNKLTRAQYHLDEVTWTTKSWLGLQKQRISVVLHAIAEQIVNELACGEGGRCQCALVPCPDMSLGELIYFPVQAKGLQLAILAEASGLEWTGFTVDKSPAGPKSWPAIKASGASPFGQLPMLRTPGGRVVGQSVAIANYIAHRASMHGAGDDDFALSQMCLAEGEDLYSLLLGAELARWKPREVRAAKAAAVRGLIATT